MSSTIIVCFLLTYRYTSAIPVMPTPANNVMRSSLDDGSNDIKLFMIKPKNSPTNMKYSLQLFYTDASETSSGLSCQSSHYVILAYKYLQLVENLTAESDAMSEAILQNLLLLGVKVLSYTNILNSHKIRFCENKISK